MNNELFYLKASTISNWYIFNGKYGSFYSETYKEFRKWSFTNSNDSLRHLKILRNDCITILFYD